MHPTSPGRTRPKKRIPKWIGVTLGVFLVLFILGAIFGKTPEQTPTLAAAPAPAPTVTTAPPAPVTYTVTSALDTATLAVTGSDGTQQTLRVLGLVAPVTGTGCYSGETLAWTKNLLVGKVVKLGTQTARGVALTLADGTDYATAALKGGYAKYATDAALAPLEAAEKAAHQAGSGLWGPPCNGVIDAPAPVATPTPQPAPKTEPAPSTQAAPPRPETTEQPAPAPKPDPGVYYKNCAAAKAAGAAPLHLGEPGYRPALDADHDGVACER
ncbi:excalibur calcium-binding domain-containing protein [Amycolatopsis samaneae]|uniref:Excalibur calcium-binding domain-containing protein n=1 Tax=Amycolatopsis samaneae TaxID=664691 RepID=A0ABW5GH55_9PSEU